jgi:hypothetical protein
MSFWWDDQSHSDVMATIILNSDVMTTVILTSVILLWWMSLCGDECNYDVMNVIMV